jgi:hypothetical protein
MAFKYVKGDSYKDRDDDLKTYSITELHDDDTVNHGNKIEVYGDIKLRNKIIKLLNGGEKDAL